MPHRRRAHNRPTPVNEAVRAALTVDPATALPQLPTSGYVIDSLRLACWAFGQPDTLEQTLLDIVNPRR